MKTKPLNDILKKQMKSNKFAKEYKKELKKIKQEARLREAERDIELGNVTKMFYKPTEAPNLFFKGFWIGATLGITFTILLGHFFVVMPLLTNL